MQGPNCSSSHGWSPIIGLIFIGGRVIQEIVDWIGGSGTPPPTGGYVGPNDIVSNTAEAVNLAGPDGLQGVVGITGATGATGATGPRGDQGVSGPDGLPGFDGFPGEIGEIGEDGPDGPPGETGDQGQACYPGG